MSATLTTPAVLYVIALSRGNVTCYVAHDAGRMSAEPSTARKFSTPADAWCYLESAGPHYRDWTAEVVEWRPGP